APPTWWPICLKRRWTGYVSRSRWAGSGSRRRSPGWSPSWRRTSPRTSPGRSGPSTAAWTCDRRSSTCDLRSPTGGVMDNGRDVFVLSGTRTPIGKYGGGLAAVPPCDLGATVVREAVSRAGVGPAEVGHAVFGNVIHTEVRDMYLG